MTVINKILMEVLNNGGLYRRQDSIGTSTTPTASSSATTSPTPSQSNNPSNGPTSSPLLFFVALGFGVVFTNLWIIVGVKYCFRYNARNRAARAAEEGEPINMDNMPTRPHRRRREKKLMAMDEVNERFPLMKYKNWVASRAREGLPTSGGVTAPSSRPGSLRNVDAYMSTAGQEPSTDARPPTAKSEAKVNENAIEPASNTPGHEQKGSDVSAMEEKGALPMNEDQNALETVPTTVSTVDKQPTSGEEEDEEDDDHIHTAVPPELLTNPGDSCAICIDTLEGDDDIRGLTCGHAFHAGCLDPWLTSRRACCPLCKADYYTPKPRPEGEAAVIAEAERTRRTNSSRVNLPQPPRSALSGIREGLARILFPARFGASQPRGNNRIGHRAPRRTRPRATVPAQEATASTEETTLRGWRPRIANPFSAVSMPQIRIPGRARQNASTQELSNTNPTPSQLEAGVAP